MKKTFLTLVSILLTAVVSNAAPGEISDFKKVTLNVCVADAVGCSHSINIEGKTFPVDIVDDSTEAGKMVRQLVENHQLHNLSITEPFLARGYFAFMRLFPNPSMEVLGFVITDVDAVVMPRSVR